MFSMLKLLRKLITDRSDYGAGAISCFAARTATLLCAAAPQSITSCILRVADCAPFWSALADTRARRYLTRLQKAGTSLARQSGRPRPHRPGSARFRFCRSPESVRRLARGVAWAGPASDARRSSMARNVLAAVRATWPRRNRRNHRPRDRPSRPHSASSRSMRSTGCAEFRK